MIRIDPLYLLLLLEFILILTVALGYLILRYRKASKNRTAKEFIGLSDLLAVIEEEERALNEKIERISDTSGGDIDLLIEKRSYELHLQFLKDAIKSSNTGFPGFSGFITRGFRETANRSLLWVKELLEKRDRIIKEVEKGLAERESAIDRLRSILIKQKRRMADLMSSQEMLVHLKKKFDLLREKNGELKERLRETLGGRDKGSPAEELLKEMEEINRELEICVETLENENKKLQERLISYEEGFGNIEQDILGMLSLKKTPKDIEEMEGMIKELKDKDKEIREVRKEKEDLEKEYMVLYKQVNS